MESHGEDLRTLIQDDQFIQHLKNDHPLTQLNQRQQVLCTFAQKLTLTPSEMKPEDLETLRQNSLSEEDILDAVQVIGFFNYMNRLSDALGCDLEPWMQTSDGGSGSNRTPNRNSE